MFRKILIANRGEISLRVLRLAGQGIQGADGDAGDHYVRVKVRLPKTLTEEQRKALEAFR